ncbi:MAG TPA: molybdate ABC transporter substrate-binding protein [Pyrinomonadaceae bacterium]
MRKFSSFVFVCLLVIACSSCKHQQPAATSPELHVAAAADLIPAFEEMGKAFEAANHVKVVFSFGSTGMLTQQIENGAPMDVFAAASVDFIDRLQQKGLILDDTKAIYAHGRITIWTTKDSKLKIEKINDLTNPDVKRIAIANPDHAPYGMAARDALQKAGIWDAVQPKIVLGENIRQTLQFAETGNVDVAIVALSLSKEGNGKWILIPQELHKPINQGLAVIKSTQNEKTAREFASFITGTQGQAILAKYGFE